MKIEPTIMKTGRDGHQMVWRDDQGRRHQRRCYGKTAKARKQELAELEAELNERYKELSWAAFWSLCEDDHLAALSRAHGKKCRTMHNRLAETAKRRGITDLRCSEIDRPLLLAVESSMRKSGVEETTINSNMAALWSMITWGQDHDLIPEFRRPRRRKGKKTKQKRKAKGRALVAEEIERLRMCIPLACKRCEDPKPFIDAANAMLHIGMRLSECWLFSWDPIPGTHHPIRLDTAAAAIEFSPEQKSGETSIVPLTNEAIDWLRDLRQHRSDSPWVCRTSGRYGTHKTPDRIGRVISGAGRKAGIVVKQIHKRDGTTKTKCASAHDLRRTFATNLMQVLNVSELQQMTRHSDTQTLLDFYAEASTPMLVAKLRGE